MASKQNDLMLNILANPQFTIEDFQKVGLSAQNTSLEDEETYLNSDIITSNPLFLDANGEFDKVKFHNIYLKAAQGLNTMNNEPQNFQAVYSKYNIWAPTDQRENEPTFSLVKEKNPDRLTKSMLSIGQNGPREFTPQEIAQSQKMWDTENNKWIDSPEDMFSVSKLFNDFVGFFTDNFGSTKVMAQYEEDTDINGKQRGEIGFDENNIEHYKGDYMLNDNGTYYYRTLKDGENIYGKQVLHYSDILTREGSALNSIDFFDSDDIKKSPFGTFIKDASLIGAMFIPWGVGTTIAGATIFQQAAGLGATLGKLALGSSNPTMNWVEGLVESTNPMNTRSEWSQIDYGNTGRNTTWTIENLLGMVGDVVGQLRQQRLLFQYAPVIFKGKWGINEKQSKLLEEKYLQELNNITKRTKLSKYNPEDVLLYKQAESKLLADNALKASTMVEDYMKQYNKVGEELSKAYMTLLTVNDIYGEAKEAGAEDFDAALVTAGYAAMEYYLLSTDIGKWILPELRGERLQNKAMVRALSRDTLAAFRQLGKEAASSEGAKKTYLQRLVDFGKSVAKGEFNVGLGKRAAFKDGEGLLKAGLGSLLAGASAEAVEETTEELLADFSRVLYNGLEQLQGKDSRMSPFENAFDRYAMSFLGGFLGGGISSAAFEVNQARKTAKMNYDQAMQHLIYKAHNNDLDGIYKILDSEKIGNDKLSATKFDKDENGNIIWKQGDENDNQDLAIKQAIRRQLDLVVNTLKAHGGKTDDELIDAQLLGDLRYRALRNTTTAGLFLQKYNETLTELVKKVNERKNLDNPIVKTEHGEGDQKDSKNEELEIRRSKLDKDIEELDKKLEEFHSGMKAPLFMATALIESTPYIASALMSATFKVFAEEKTNTSFDKIPENELKRLEIEYQNYLKSDKKDDLQLATKAYLMMSNIIKQNLEKAQEIINEQVKNPEIGKLLSDVSISLGQLDFAKDGDEWQEQFGQWAASNVFKVGGLDVASQIQTLHNTYQENLKNNQEVLKRAQDERDAKVNELESQKALEIQEIESAFNLGELGGGIDEETRKNSLEEIDKKYKELIGQYDGRLQEMALEKDRADKSSKESLDKELHKVIFDISLKQANTLANEIIKAGFINGAIKNQVIDKLSNMSKVLDTTYKPIISAYQAKLDEIDLDRQVFESDIQSYTELEGSPEGAFEQAFEGNSKEVYKLWSDIQEYEKAKQEIESKIEKIKNLEYTPVINNLDNFALNIGKAKISTLLDTLGKLLSTSRQSVSSFIVTDNIYKQIKEAERVVDLYLAALEGARVDNIDPIRVGVDLQGNIGDTSNVWGINKVLNEVHKKSPKIENDSWVDLPEIEGQSADMMIEDVRRIKRLLNSYKTLHSINQGQKLNAQSRVSNKTIYVIYSKLNRLLANVEFPDKEKLIGVLNELSLLKEITSQEPTEWRTSLSKEEQIKLEKERVQMEDAIFDYFSDKIDDVEKLKEIFNPKNFAMWDSTASLLTEGTEDINDTSFIGYLAAKASLKTSSFLKNFKEILKDGNIAPIISQEIGVQLGLANILNGNAVSNIIQAYKESLLEMSDNEIKEFLKKAGYSDKAIEAYSTQVGFKLLVNDDLIPQYNNITFIEGVAGSGKSSGVDALINKYLKRYHSDFTKWISHGGDTEGGNYTKEFARNIGEENPEEISFDKNQLLNKIFEDYIPPKSDANNRLIYNKEAYEIDSDGKIQPKWKTKKDVEAPKVLFLDEMQQFSQLELLALDKWAAENGVSIIGSGDLGQSQLMANIDLESVIKEINKEKKLFSSNTFHVKLSRNQVLHTPKLGTSMRTANNQKNINMTNTQVVQALGEGTIELHYYEDDKTLAGDKQLDKTNKDEIIRHLDKIIPLLEQNEKINFIYSSKDSTLKEWLEKQEKYNKHLNFKPDTALGQEGRYWVVEISDSDSETFLQDFYTGQTRSKIFTLMLVPSQVKKVNIINVQDQETHEERYSSTAVRKYANEKVAVLEQIGLNEVENFVYKPRIQQEHQAINKDTKKPAEKVDSEDTSAKNVTPLRKRRSRRKDTIKKVNEESSLINFDTDLESKGYTRTNLADVPGIISNSSELNKVLLSKDGNNLFQMDSGGRIFVIANVNGVVIPFYMSAHGTDGKIKGAWYPFFGMTGTWLVKGSIDPDGKMNYSPEIDRITQLLNDNLHLDSTQPIHSIAENIPGFTAYSFDDRFPELSFTPSNLRGHILVDGTQTKNNVEYNPGDSRKRADEVYVEEITGIDASNVVNGPSHDGFISGQSHINNILNSIKKEESATPPVDIFQEEDEISPEEISEETDDLTEGELQRKLDEDNGLQVDQGTEITEDTVPGGESSYSVKNFKFQLFTNSSFEVGGLIDQDGMVSPSEIPHRIDGINGIFDKDITNKEWIALQQEALKNEGKVPLQMLEHKLGQLRRILLSTSDKGLMETRIASNLGLKSDTFVRFAIKTSSFDTDFDSEEFSKLEKDPKEQSTHARAQVSKSSESNKTNNRFLVAIIGTDHDIIEIPLINLNNPITIIRRLGQDSWIFQKFTEYFDSIEGTSGEKQIEALKLLLENDFKGPEYAGFANLIQMYINTYRNIVFIDDIQWTPSKDLICLGIQFNIDRGVGIYDNEDYVETKQWSSLEELRADPSFARISQPMQLKQGMNIITSEDGESYVEVGNPKHPMVLVSDTNYDHNGNLMRTDNDLIKEFIYQQFNDVPKTVQLVYILPPKFTIREYLQSLCDFMTGKTKESPLGNQRTAFKILKALFKASENNPQELLNCFTRALGEEQGRNLYNKTKQTIDDLNKLITREGKPDIRAQIQKLTGTSELWVEGIPQDIPLYRQLQNVLKQLVMPQRVVMETEEDGSTNIYVSFKGSESDFDVLIGGIETLFDKSGISLYYQVKGSKTESYGIFAPLQLDSEGRINDPRLKENLTIRPNGLGFSVTGSIASSAFETNSSFNKTLQGLVRKQEHVESGDGSYIRTADNNKYVGRRYVPERNGTKIEWKPILVTPYSGFKRRATKNNLRSIEKLSIDPKILNKLEGELSQEVYQDLISKLNPTTENDHSSQLLQQIATIINSQKLDYKVLVINGQLRTCQNNIFKDVDTIIGSPQQNGPNILIPITINGIRYDGVYYNGELSLLEVNPKPITQVTTNTEITQEFVENNLGRFNELFNYILQAAGQLNINKVVQKRMQEALNNSEKLFKMLSTQAFKGIIEKFDISKYNDILNPKQEQEVCSNPIKLKFK